MNTSLISSTISEISLYLDPKTLEEIKKFIQTFLGNSWEINPKLYIYVCTAIVCQCKKIPAIQSKIVVPFGINVQKIMKYYSAKSKQDFLITMINIVEKWSTCPQLFINKLQYLRLSYRIFKKYHDCCLSIGQKLSIKYEINYLNSSLFWIIYLLAKHNFNQSQSLQVMTNIIPLLIKQIYNNYLQQENKINIIQMITKYMNYPDLESESIKQSQIKYNKQIKKILVESYERRYLTEKINFNFLINKPQIIQRLIDDLNNRYTKQLQKNIQEFIIDEISFLQLRKDMVPQVFHQKIDKNELLINEKLQFENEMISLSYTKQQQVSKKQIIYQQKYQNTPCTIRTQNLAWIRNCIQDLQAYKIDKVQEHYKKYHFKDNHNFYQSIQLKIEKIIQEFSPTCKNYSKRKKQIYTFFIYCINIAIEMYNQQIQKIFKNYQSLCSILCLSTQIFNFIYQAYSGNYTRYCQIFQIQFINAFFPINWFGYYLKLPKNVDDHLYTLQRKFLLKQIWNTQLGFKIITNNQEIIKINQSRMLERLWKHIKSRIDEICRETIGEKMVKKIYNIVMQIIQKKPILLQKNNIDQIIICSMTACLSLNEDSNQLQLQKIFNFYTRSSFNSQDSKDKLFDKNSNEVNIVQFYNDVFLQEIQQIIKNFPETSNILSHPKRLYLIEQYKLCTEIKPLKQKYIEYEPSFIKKKINKNQDPQYQRNLARNIQIYEQNRMIEQSQQQGMQNQNKDNFK